RRVPKPLSSVGPLRAALYKDRPRGHAPQASRRGQPFMTEALSMSSVLRRTAAPSTRRPARRRSLLLETLEDRTVPTLLGNTLFPADNPWNQNIANAPVASNSAAIINNITSHYGDGRLHPDFSQDFRGGNDLYGVPYNVVHGNTVPRVHVVIDAYAGESDVQDAPIPASAVLE